MQGNFEEAAQYLEESLKLSRALDDESGVCTALGNLGIVAHQQGYYECAQRLYEESAQIARKTGDEWLVALTVANLGLTLLKLGHYDEGMRLNEEAMAGMQKLGDKHGVSRVLNNMAEGALEHREYGRAERVQLEALELTRDLRDTDNIPQGLEILANIVAAQGNGERAAYLWGAAEALREELQVPLSKEERTMRDRYGEMVRAHTSHEVFSAAWQRGRSMTPDQAVAYALQVETAVKGE